MAIFEPNQPQKGQPMAKKSKWAVVATEGATTDGRTIQRNWIEEMAESYDPKTSTAHASILTTSNSLSISLNLPMLIALVTS